MVSPLTAEQIERGKVLDQRDEERLDLLDSLLSRLGEVVDWAEDEKIDTERRRSGRQEAIASLPKAPRTWSLPAEPGPEVTAVRCACCGYLWTRERLRGWTVDLWVPSAGGIIHGREWRPLLVDHGAIPLTDATPTTDPTGSNPNA